MLSKAILSYNHFIAFRCFSTAQRVPVGSIRINKREEQVEANYPQAAPIAYFPEAYKPVQNPTWIARKHNIDYSAWKLMSVANLIKGKHIYDAMNIIGRVDKKGGPVVKSVLEACRKNGENKGF